jgi:hypothetical protein
MNKTKIFLILLLLLTMSYEASAQNQYEFAYKDSHGEYLSDHFISFDYFDDTTIVVKCKVDKRMWRSDSDRAHGFRFRTYEFLKYDIGAGYMKWFIKDNISNWWPGPTGYTKSPDNSTLIYIAEDKDINVVYQHNLITRERNRLEYPDSFWARKYNWNPKKDAVWVTGFHIDPANWIDEEIVKSFPVHFNGPACYIYYPSEKEYKQIISENRWYSSESGDYDDIWTADGKALYFWYPYYFAIYGPDDSLEVYDVESSVVYLYRYDLDQDSITLMHAGDWSGGGIQNDILAYDTSLITKSMIYIKGERSKIKSFHSYNPQTNESKVIWSVDDYPGIDITDAYLSPDRKFIAYYTEDEFILEELGDTCNYQLYSCEISLKGHKGHADFSDDNRKVCFSTHFTELSECTSPGQKDFGYWSFEWGDIVSKKE